MKIQYITKKFNKKSSEIINQANSIIEEYRKQGFDLTLRQLYYQFVARGIIENSQQAYRKIGKVISDARLAGLVSWESIVDRTRYLRGFNTWESPGSFLKDQIDEFKIDFWKYQKYAPEVWIEKDALVGVIAPICAELRLDYFSCRGYSSQSALFRAGHWRFRNCRREPVVFHLGDHDPSGIDMTRDLQERLSLFADREVEVRRLALNMDQVEEFNPPPNPAKLSDARAADYVAEHGHESWELDALDPTTIEQLIRESVGELIDWPLWDATREEEEDGIAQLRSVAEELNSDD